MNIVASYTVSEIFEVMSAHRGRATMADGRTLKVSSSRLRLFFLKGITCIRCGVTGTEFRLEHHNGEAPHLNLYAVDEDGKAILMTKDHIIPKSRGGAEHMDNFQTMCVSCNGKKGNRLEEEVAALVMQ